MPDAVRSDEVTALPRTRTRLIGRERELETLAGLLSQDDVALVTLIGPGGVGKTRLALAVAGTLGDAFPDGIVFVQLAPLNDAALVVPAIASALGVDMIVPPEETMSSYHVARQAKNITPVARIGEARGMARRSIASRDGRHDRTGSRISRTTASPIACVVIPLRPTNSGCCCMPPSTGCWIRCAAG